jgi:hypothetical protein
MKITIKDWLLLVIFTLVTLAANAQYLPYSGEKFRTITEFKMDRKFAGDTLVNILVRSKDTTATSMMLINGKDTTAMYQIRDTAFLNTTATRWNIKPALPCCVTIITGSAALNFGSIGGHDEETLNITVTGASVGDVVSLGIPVSAMVTHAQYNVYVSDTNVVSVRCYNNNGGTINPPSATFNVKVLK